MGKLGFRSLVSFRSLVKLQRWVSLGIVGGIVFGIVGCAQSEAPSRATQEVSQSVPATVAPAAVVNSPQVTSESEDASTATVESPVVPASASVPVAAEPKPVPIVTDAVPASTTKKPVHIFANGVIDDADLSASRRNPTQKAVSSAVDKTEQEPASANASTAESAEAKSTRKPMKAGSSPSLITSFLKAFNTPAQSTRPTESVEDSFEIPKTIPKDSNRRIKVKASAGWLSLQTFCVDHEGQLVALLGTSRYAEEKGKNAEVQILSPEGEVVKEWKLSFPGQSINVGPDHLIYVAGDGKVAKYDNEGNELALVALPHIEEMITDQDKMRKDAEDLLKQQQESYNKMAETTEQRIAREKEKLKDEKTKLSSAMQIDMLETQLKMYREAAKESSNRDVSQVINQQLSRLKIINSIAVSEKDVFLVCGDNKGYGYNLWRTDLGFHDAQVIIKNLRGCCGQMDVQVSGEEIVVAENTLHKFGRYDREGKLIGKYGKKGRNGSADCFGGCCNPMNVRAAANGDVFTAESEGVIKHYSSDGKFQGEVGKCSLTGGCKNVAVAVSPDNKFVYFCDQPGSQIIVLEMPAQEVVGKN